MTNGELAFLCLQGLCGCSGILGFLVNGKRGAGCVFAVVEAVALLMTMIYFLNKGV